MKKKIEEVISTAVEILATAVATFVVPLFLFFVVFFVHSPWGVVVCKVWTTFIAISFMVMGVKLLILPKIKGPDED